MGETLGPVTFPRRHSPFLEPQLYAADGKREYSDAIAQAIDLETKKMLEERLEHVLELLQSKRQLLDRVAALLLDKETVEAEEFAHLVQEEVGVLSA